MHQQSTLEQELTKEFTLDPANWQELRQLGHRMLDDMFDYLSTVRERAAWKKPTSFAIGSMQQPLPEDPQSAEEVYEEFFTQVLPFNNNNIHPRFWGWVEGSGTPVGMLADMLASGMNPTVSGGNSMPMYVEKQVIEWSKEMFHFPEAASGLLTSGASMANITALLVARNHFNANIRKKGIHAAAGQLTVYGSSETHSCVTKAVEIIGIGSEHFRKIPVNDRYEIDLEALQEAIAADRAAGYIPFCIIGNAGTVNTGSIDPLTSLVQIAKKEKLWLHIDGAFGAIPYLLPEFRQQLQAISEADSLSFDFHKWFYVNYEVGCVLIRDTAIHRDAFALSVNYLMAHEHGLAAGPDAFSNYGPELSRGFKALKVWMSLKTHGLSQYKRLIRQNLEQAQYFAAEVCRQPQLELLAPVNMNIVCYRFNPGHLDETALNALNKEIMMQLHERGIAIPSSTLLEGRYAIRVAITNHRSRLEDFNILAKESIRIGNELATAQPKS